MSLTAENPNFFYPRRFVVYGFFIIFFIDITKIDQTTFHEKKTS